MIFKEKVKNTEYKSTDKITKVRLDLEPKRENDLQRINKVYSKEVYSNNKRIGRTKIIKIAIDNLIRNLEDISEEEGVEFIRALYKEAEF